MISYQIANLDRTYSVSVPKDEVIRYVKLSFGEIAINRKY